MSKEIELWEQEIEVENKYQESIKEDTIYNFYDTGSSELVQEGLIAKLKEKFLKKSKNEKPVAKKKEIDIEAFKKNYPTIMKIVKDSFKEAGSPKGFSVISSKSEQNYDDIISGDSDYLPIIWKDILKFIEPGENARDDEVNLRFWNTEDKLFKTLKKNGITEFGFIEDQGDWDDGDIDLVLK